VSLAGVSDLCDMVDSWVHNLGTQLGTQFARHMGQQGKILEWLKLKPVERLAKGASSVEANMNRLTGRHHLT
jgi:hypothetical protein